MQGMGMAQWDGELRCKIGIATSGSTLPEDVNNWVEATDYASGGEYEIIYEGD